MSAAHTPLLLKASIQADLCFEPKDSYLVHTYGAYSILFKV